MRRNARRTIHPVMRQCRSQRNEQPAVQPGRRGRGESGQTLTVELVLLFPLMLALTLGVLEFGWWVNAHIVTSNAASQAARSVAIEGKISTGTVPNQIQAVASGGDLATNNIKWSASAGGIFTPVQSLGSTPTQCIYQPTGGFAPMTASVTVTYQYHLLFPFLASPMFFDIGKAIPSTITATASAPVEQEWVTPC